ncbi:MAG TPA: lamin tail domain-containing protein [Kofleriaceae bacterium]|nr:lamin tail domain-containing protein [Kofleriaceae bacterium]
MSVLRSAGLAGLAGSSLFSAAILTASAALVGAAACSTAEPEPERASAAAAASATDGVLRVAAANLTSGGPQDYDAGHGQRILAGTGADLVLIQEMNVGDDSDAALRDFVDDTFGPEFSVFREPDRRIPNAVISRFPIIDSGAWTDSEAPDREFVFARIDVPGPRDLWGVSVHLLTTSTARRRTEAIQLSGTIRDVVPEGDLLVIGGDFNTGSMAESAFDELADVVVVDGPRPVDNDGNPNTNQSRAKPYDHVLPDPDLAALRVPTRIGDQEFPTGLVVDTRVYDPIGDLAPAQRGDSGAPSMQHMAVLVDFAIDDDAGTPDAGVPDAGTPDAGTPDAGVPDAGSPDASTGPAEIVLNEILANEPGSNTDGEFVELYNPGAEDADLGGFTLSDSTSVRHVFASGEVLRAGSSIVVTAGDSTDPDTRSASTGALSLANGGDSVVLRDAGGAVVASFSYTSALTGRDGVSMTRTVDGDSGSAFALHDDVSDLASSPNRRNDGTPF